MRSRGRVWRVGKWAGVILCALIVAAWIHDATRSDWDDWFIGGTQRWKVYIKDRALVAVSAADWGPSWMDCAHMLLQPTPQTSEMWPAYQRGPTRWGVELAWQRLQLPLWFAFWLVAIPTIVSWRRGRLAYCPACGRCECGRVGERCRRCQARLEPTTLRELVMRTPRRVRGIARTTGVSSLVLLATGWVLSVPPCGACDVMSGYTSDHWMMTAEAGVVTLFRDPSNSASATRFFRTLPQRMSPHPTHFVECYGLELPKASIEAHRLTVRAPIWLLIALVGLPTAFLYYVDHDRAPAGYCGRCGYDLTKNESGVCPECGLACASIEQRDGSRFRRPSGAE